MAGRRLPAAAARSRRHNGANSARDTPRAAPIDWTMQGAARARLRWTMQGAARARLRWTMQGAARARLHLPGR
jgi:hypothetical protein